MTRRIALLILVLAAFIGGWWIGQQIDGGIAAYQNDLYYYCGEANGYNRGLRDGRMSNAGDVPSANQEVKYLDREVIKEVEKIVYRNLVYRDWESVEQFLAWFEAQKFYPIFPSRSGQCEEYAERVQRVALEQGYPISTVETNASGYYADTYIGKPYHEGNKVTIGNDIFYVEPIPGDFRMVKVMVRN